MRPIRVPLATLAAAAVLVAGCANPTPTAVVPVAPVASGRPAATATRPASDPTVAADAATFGSWRRAPAPPSGRIATASEEACRARPEVGDLPLRLMDNRGDARLLLLFTDAGAAVVCHVEVAESGEATADARSLPALVAAPPPTKTKTLGAYDIELIEQGVPRLVLVGRAADVPTVEVGFDDTRWATSTMAGGWYAIWWPQAALALTVASVDRRNVVIHSFPVP